LWVVAVKREKEGWLERAVGAGRAVLSSTYVHGSVGVESGVVDNSQGKWKRERLEFTLSR
jgi:hypothetical protein